MVAMTDSNFLNLKKTAVITVIVPART